MIKAIFFDIDGTLVSLKHAICPPSAREAVQTLRKKGVACYIATGRSKFEIVSERMLDGLTFDGYLTCNGQAVYDDPQGKLLYGTPIDPQEAAAVVDWIERDGCSCWLVGEDENMMNHLTPASQAALVAIHTPPPCMGDVRRMLQRPIYKIVIFLPRKRIQELITIAPNCRATQWFSEGFDLASVSGGKKNAMLAILRQNGIDPSECMAFGDSENDAEMLRAAGIGVAMGNGTPEVFAAADYITADCDDDGVAKALRHFGVL